MNSVSHPKPLVTGYPAVPPPPTAAHPTDDYYSSHPCRPHDVVCGIIILVTVVVLTVAIPLLLTDRHRPPTFALSSASLSNFNLSASQHLLSSDFDISFSVCNPNHKLGINYKSVSVAVFYRSYDIARTSLPTFYQDKASTTTVQARIVTAAEYVEDDVAKGIATDRGRGDGVVNFNVRLFAWFTLVDDDSNPFRMSVYCEDVPIGFKNGTATLGSLVGSPMQCKVDIPWFT